MAEVAIITDSTAYIPQGLVERYHIRVVPQVLIWGEESFLDGVDIQPAEFYARLSTSKTIPTTSQATVASFHSIFEPLAEKGVPMVVILISDELSGTLQSAHQAKEMFPQATIEVIDSRSTSMELGFHVLAAARAAEAGESLEEVVRIAREAQNHTGVFFVVDTLEFLHRGGRIGGASRLVGTALKIKPLLHLKDGRVEPFEKVRTKKKALARLLDVIGERVDGKPNVRLAGLHAVAESEVVSLLEEAKRRFNPVETILSEVSPVVGTHVGPGTVGLAYCTEI